MAGAVFVPRNPSIFVHSPWLRYQKGSVSPGKSFLGPEAAWCAGVGPSRTTVFVRTQPLTVERDEGHLDTYRPYGKGKKEIGGGFSNAPSRWSLSLVSWPAPLALRDEQARSFDGIGTATTSRPKTGRDVLLAVEKRLLEMIRPKRFSLAHPRCLYVRLVGRTGDVSCPRSFCWTTNNQPSLRHGVAPSFANFLHLRPLMASPSAVSWVRAGRLLPRGGHIVSAIATDPLWSITDDPALRARAASVLVEAATLSQQGLGTFAIYYLEPRVPTPQIKNSSSRSHPSCE